MDILGSAIAGRERKTVGIMERLVRSIGGGKEEATMICCGRKASLPNATLVNSAMATVLDSDDGGRSAVGGLGHIGGCVIPAALAVAEREHASGKAFLEAVVVGYEVYLKTSWMLAEPNLKKFSMSGTPGAYGAAAAVGKLLKLTHKQITNALGIAESYAPVPKIGKIALTGPMTKEAMPWGSMTGLMSALLAQMEFTGPKTIYDDTNVDKSILGSLGKEYDILKIYFKPYAACRYTHTAIEIVLQLVKEKVLTAENVKDITVEVNFWSALLNCPRPETIEHAEYSFPFVIAVALLDEEVGPNQIKESRLTDEAVLKIANKVKVAVSEDMNAILPAKVGAIVTIETRDGKRHRMRRDTAKGGSEEPFTYQELEEKFRKWARTAIAGDRAEKVLNAVNNMEELTRMNDLIEFIADP